MFWKSGFSLHFPFYIIYQSINLFCSCPGNETKLSEGEAPVMLELWGMSLSLLPVPFWPGVVVPDWVGLICDWTVWHSCRMGARNQEQTRGRIGPQLRLGNLRVGELPFCPLCHPYTALDQASSLSRKLAYVPGPTFGFVKLLASSGSHCTKWADEQHRQAGFESRLVPDLPSPLSPL